MARLREPQGGCPWDVEQTFASIAPYTIEEAYEVADAIARENWPDLKDELGDLLLQVVYHSRIAEERELFAFVDVARAITEKMVRRHPHVFGTEKVDGAVDQSKAWEKVKAAERAARAGQDNRPGSVLDDVPVALPALKRAQKLLKRVAAVNFRWPDRESALQKVREEVSEVEDALAASTSGAEREEEVGDLLLSIVSLAAAAGCDAETALRVANSKFERRFRAVEKLVALDGTGPLPDLATLTAAWDQVKEAERTRRVGDQAGSRGRQNETSSPSS